MDITYMIGYANMEEGTDSLNLTRRDRDMDLTLRVPTQWHISFSGRENGRSSFACSGGGLLALQGRLPATSIERSGRVPRSLSSCKGLRAI